MIVKEVINSDKAYFVMPEDADDLFSLRRIIESGDYVVGDSVTIDKGRKWSDLEVNILRKSGDASSFILIAIDTQEAAIAKLSGTHLEIIPNIYSGKSGKRYPQATKKDSKTESFFGDISRMITDLFIVEKDRLRAIIF